MGIRRRRNRGGTDEAPSIEDRAEFASQSAYCPECGAEVWDDSQHCSACGAWFSMPAPTPPARFAIWKSLALILFGLAAAGLLLMFILSEPARL